jgi:hypothetical protein
MEKDLEDSGRTYIFIRDVYYPSIYLKGLRKPAEIPRSRYNVT